MSERLIHVVDFHSFGEAVSADVSQFANRVSVGIKAVRKKSILDQPLQQVFQRPGAGWLVNPPHIYIPDHVLQHFTGTRDGHFWRNVGDLDRLLDAIAKYVELTGEMFQAIQQGLKRRVHSGSQMDWNDQRELDPVSSVQRSNDVLHARDGIRRVDPRPFRDRLSRAFHFLYLLSMAKTP